MIVVQQQFFELGMCNLIKIFALLNLASIEKLLYHEVFLENLLLFTYNTFLFQTVESDCLLAALSWTCFSYLKYCCNSIHFYWTGLALGLNRFLKCKQFSVPLLMTLYGDLFYCFCPSFVPFTQITQNKNIHIFSTYYHIKYKLFILKRNKAKVDHTFFKLFQLNLDIVFVSYLAIA